MRTRALAGRATPSSSPEQSAPRSRLLQCSPPQPTAAATGWLPQRGSSRSRGDRMGCGIAAMGGTQACAQRKSCVWMGSPFAAASCGDCGSTSPKSHSPSPMMSATPETRHPPTCFTTDRMQLVLPSSEGAEDCASPSEVSARPWAVPVDSPMFMSCLRARGVLMMLVRLLTLPSRSSRGGAAVGRGSTESQPRRTPCLGQILLLMAPLES